MNTITKFYTSSVGRKVLMSLTGLFLCSFLIVHLYINLFLFAGERSFEGYAEFMATYPLLRPIEIVLFLGFLLHAAIGVWLWIQNRMARPDRYAVNASSDNSTLSSRVAFWTGLVVAGFLVVHINAFFITSRFLSTGKTMYEVVAESFHKPVTVLFYLVALGFLGYHLKHGFQSAFQTLGWRTSRYAWLIDAVGVIFWLLIPLCFAAMPLYFLWAH
jgi:succinate dehydrogenase / fumarate reductase cytochrome b subunit